MNTIHLVAELARTLEHGCAPTPEQESAAVSLRHLNAFMRLNGIAYNDSPEARYGPGFGYEGWAEVGDSHNQILRHLTGTGRLSVTASEEAVELEFYAGDPSGNPDGVLCARVHLTPRPDRNFTKLDAFVEFASAELLDGRPDRLSILWDFNRALGDQIVRSLREQRQSGLTSEVTIVFKALQALDQYAGGPEIVYGPEETNAVQ